MKVGVLALQGAFREHREAFEALDADVTLVRRPEHLAGVDVVVLPGGESTTVDKLLDTSELREPLREAIADGLPALLTCAGLIVCAAEVRGGRPDQRPLGLVDVTVSRNAYGTQRESFEAPLDISGVSGGAFPAVFIRAPVIERSGPGVVTRAEHDGTVVLGHDGAIWFSTFHPELSGDLRVHQLFLNET